MTIPVSTAPTAKLFVFNGVTALAAAVTDFRLRVFYDEPGPDEPDDMIVVGDVTRQVQPLQMVGSGGAGWLDETYDIDVTVDVFRGGDFAQATDQRAWALVGVVETVVRTDPSLGGAVIEAYPSLANAQGMWDDDHKGRRTRIVVPIRCHARI